MPNNNEREEAIKKHPYVASRETPNNYEAEVAILGGMLIDGETAAKFIPQLAVEDFYTPAHRCIFEAMASLFRAVKPIDLVTVVGALEANGTLELSGGTEYIYKTMDAVPSVANTEYYFSIVKKMTQLRTVIEIAKRMADEAYALDSDNKAVSNAVASLFALEEKTHRGKLEQASGFIEQFVDDLKLRERTPNLLRGVPTGFQKLDSMLGGGFQKGDLVVLAARPGQGKTSFAMNCAVNAARRRRPEDGNPYVVAVFSLEMSTAQLVKRIMCSVGKYDMSRANRAHIINGDWDRLYAAQMELTSAQLYIDESGDITPAELLSKCRALKHSVGLDFVMIDYLQLMQSGKRVDNFVREIAEITRALKLAAKDLNVPILLLSQMSRSIEQRKGADKESKLSDLRDSGAIEQDADIVLFIDRKEVAGGDGKPAMSEVFLNVAKHRNGETGNIKLIWQPAIVTFTSSEDRGATPEPPDTYGVKGVYAESYSEDDVPPDPYAAPEPQRMSDDDVIGRADEIGLLDKNK